MIRFILTVYEWTLFVVSCFILYPIALILYIFAAPFDKRRVILHRFSCFWGSLYIWLQPLWKVTWEGKEHIKNDQAYVYVANHQALLDIIVIYTLFRHFKWVAKSALLKVPFVGWNMALNDYIFVKRSDSQSQIKMMKQSEKALREGSSLMIFAEGTRSPDGELGEFKRGAFMLSQIAGVWVVGLLFLFVTVFSGATLISFLGSVIPYKGWSFDKKFYRFFLIIAMILVPLSAAYMTYYSPVEISELLIK